MKGNIRIMQRIDTIIRENYSTGDMITSAKIHSKLFERHGTVYLPNRSSVSTLLRRSNLLSKVCTRQSEESRYQVI